MSHNIWNGRFINKDIKPAWHGIGEQIEDEEISAQQALERVGSYDISLQSLSASQPGGHHSQKLATNYSIIVRHPVNDDPEFRVFGSPVSSDYQLVTPDDAVRIFDEGVGNLNGVTAPIETLGVLKQGQELFITTQLAEFDIKGDEIQSYLFFYNPMYSGKAAIIGRTDIRVVCSNTLRAALNGVTQRRIFNHNDQAIHLRMTDWMKSTMEQHRDMQQIIQSAYQILAETQVGDLDAHNIIQTVYPDPPKPDIKWVGKYNTTTTIEDYMHNYDSKMEKTEFVRSTIRELYDGEGIGMDSEATAGTAFGLWNAFTQYETYRRGTYERAAISLQVGDRSSKITGAFSAINDHMNLGINN